jgi:hypothetical protein
VHSLPILIFAALTVIGRFGLKEHSAHNCYEHIGFLKESEWFQLKVPVIIMVG